MEGGAPSSATQAGGIGQGKGGGGVGCCPQPSAVPGLHAFRAECTMDVLARRKAGAQVTPPQPVSCSPALPRLQGAQCSRFWRRVCHLSRRRMEYRFPHPPARDPENSPRAGEGRRAVAGVGEAQPTGPSVKRSRAGACLRLSLHLQAPGRQEPCEVSHPRQWSIPRPQRSPSPGSVRAGDAAARTAGATRWAVLSRGHVCSRVPSACTGLSARVCGPGVSVSVPVSCSDASPASRLGEPPSSSSSQPPASPDGKVYSGAGMCGRRELRHPRGPATHPMPPASPLQLLPGSCPSAGTSSLQTRRLSSPPRAPGARQVRPGGAGRGR